MRMEGSMRLGERTLARGMHHGRNDPMVTLPEELIDAVPVGQFGGAARSGRKW